MNNKEELLKLTDELKQMVDFVMSTSNITVALHCGFMKLTLNEIEELLLEEK